MIQLYHPIIQESIMKWLLERKSRQSITNILNKSRYGLDRQTAKISDLSSGNIGKHEFLTDKYVLTEKRLVRKSFNTQKI